MVAKDVTNKVLYGRIMENNGMFENVRFSATKY